MKTKKKQYNCQECGADFKINHAMDESYYAIKFCPFCAQELWEEDDYGVDEEIDELE